MRSDRLLHLVPGPDRHGVVVHGLRLHPHLDGAELLRVDRADRLAPDALTGRVLLTQVTDRVLGADAVTGARVWARSTARVARSTVVLHDLPQASDGRHRRDRTWAYARVAAGADDVVVASEHERLLLAAALRWAVPERAAAVLARTRVLPLPVEVRDGPAGPPPETGREVATLGFVYPGKGLEQVIDAAGPGSEVVNLGGVSAGHEDLVPVLQARAAARGVRWSTTGWLDEEELTTRLRQVGVPVAAHRHLSASGSIASWIAAGRRPIVVRSRYTEELAGRMPGAVRLVGPDPSSLAQALREAQQDPASTWLPAATDVGPGWRRAGRDLARVAGRAAVSVVVPWYRDQPMLDLVLARLARQRDVAGGLEVVVADDGSPQPPVTTAAGPDLPVRVLRQPRDGFRAAAARTLGAGHTVGRVLLFLDGDTVPEDGYVAAMQQACLGAPTLAVGHRRHAADLRRHWPPRQPLPEPSWLAQGYAQTEDLARADDTGYRFVISAVLGVSRPVWDVLRGFADLRGYGGEDWELGWRAWLAGADLRHVPDAVAWHDGPDLAGRPADLAAVKNAETRRLAPVLPHPLVRGRGFGHAQPDIVAVLDARGWTDGQRTVVTESLLRQGDVGVWVGTEPPRPVLARARALVRVSEPVAVLRLPWVPYAAEVTGVLEPGVTPLLTGPGPVRVCATRHRGRLALHGDLGTVEPDRPDRLPPDWTEPVPADVLVERWRQRHPADRPLTG